jgi:hypothetical protein
VVGVGEVVEGGSEMKNVLKLTAVCLFVVGCITPTNEYSTNARISSLESQVAALEEANKDLAHASIENSESIRKVAEAVIIMNRRRGVR